MLVILLIFFISLCSNLNSQQFDPKIVQQEIAFFDVTRTGELISRLSEDTQIIKNASTTNLSEALRDLTTAFIGVGFMFSSSWKLTCMQFSCLSIFYECPLSDAYSTHGSFYSLLVLSLAVVPIISVGVRKFGHYLQELSHTTQGAAAVAASIAEVCIKCI